MADQPELTKSILATVSLVNKPLWLQISLAQGLLPKDILFGGTISSLGVQDTKISGELFYAADSDLTGACDVAGNVKPLSSQHVSSTPTYGARIDFSRDGKIFARFQFPSDDSLKQEPGSASGIFAGPGNWVVNPKPVDQPELTKTIPAKVLLVNGPLSLGITLAKGLLTKDALFTGSIFSLGVPDTTISGALSYAADSDLKGACDVAGNVKPLNSHVGPSKNYGARIDFSRDGKIFARFQFPSDQSLKQETGSASGILAGPGDWIVNPTEDA